MHRLLPLVAVSGCVLVDLSSIGRSYPALEGTLLAPGAGAEIRILRDVYGVPHVRAQTETDAWYALGFVHAQDRLFQADSGRQIAWGHLAEWFGPDLAQFDVFVRALGLEKLAWKHLVDADPETRAMLDSYALGINAGVASLGALPIEYRLLGLDWKPWTAADSYATMFLLSWTLSDNPDLELAALQLRDLEPAVLDALLRTDPHSPPIDAYWEELRKVEIGGLTPAFRGFTGVLGGAPAPAASNNWVIGGERTASGLPIVANDPHLVQRVPSLWYAADLAGGGLHVAGATIPGVPGVTIGHSERVAWGLTNVMADLVDLVVLERDGDRGYVLAGERKELRELRIEVPVRDAEPLVATVYQTEVGPVITELDGTHLVALRWASLEGDDQLPGALRRLNTVGSVTEALASTESLPLMITNNLVIADVGGDWGWRPVGNLVGRQSHTGRVPYPGSDPQHGWFGWLEARPTEHRPERGYVVTANSRPDHPLADAFSTSYVPPQRRDRIDERIRAVAEHTPEDSHAIQTDVREMGAVWHRDALLEGVEPTTDRARQCRDLLVAWDLEAARDSVGASVWALFHEEYVRAAIVDDIGTAATNVVMAVMVPGRSPLDGGGFDRFVEDRAATVSTALDQACARLALAHGDDPADWTWGEVHQLSLQHPFARRAPKLLKSWSMIPVPFPGSDQTVAAAGYGWGSSGADRPVRGMASLRMVMPLADLGASTLEHPGGQSGQPHHPLYATHYVHFVSGTALALWFDDDDVAANATHTLVLRPPGE